MRVLVVEDEKTPRELLKTLVPWSELGFDKVEIAQNGSEALAFLEAGGVDVVLTDIRMPKMDGIELAAAIRDRWPATVLIFLSAHSDKEYLKTAIRLHAQDYLDKPIEIPRVEAALRRAAEEVDHRRASANLGPLRRQAMAQAAFGLAAGESDPRWRTGSIRVLAVAPALAHRPSSSWALAVVDVLNSENFLGGVFAATLVSDQTIGVVASPERSTDVQRWEALVSELSERLVRLDPGARPRIGIAPAAEVAQASEALDRAIETLAEAFYRPGMGWYTYRGAEPRALLLADELQQLWRGLLRQGDFEGAVKVFDQLETRALAVRDPDLGRVRRVWKDAVDLFLDFVPAWGPGERQSRLGKLEADLAEAPDLAAAAQICRECFRRLFLQPAADLHSEDRVLRAREYMEVHFADPDLTVDAVAAHVGYSESYFCTVFKQTTGTTVKDFVTRLRIERAKAYLWEKSPPTLADLALKVGYRDPNYFSTVFKRLAGTSPGAYRKRALG